MESQRRGAVALLIATLFAFPAIAAPEAAQDGAATAKMARQWNSTVQTGFAENFQMVLGGTFGAGPAWQSRWDTALTNVWKNGDSVFVFGSESLDTPSLRSDWQMGAGYRRPLWRRRGQQLVGTMAWQHWKFANVKTGSNDQLTHENLTYNVTGKRLGFTATADSWSVLKSPLPTGSAIYTQAWLEHPLLKKESCTVTFRHGPADTYAWGVFGAIGHRVVRYQSMLVVTLHGTRLEGGYRKQFGLQPGIPDNRYWQFSISRTFRHR